MGAAVSILVVLFGAFSMLSQTFVLREYLVVYGGSELALGLFFSTWLTWVGAGALLAARVSRRIDTAGLFLPVALAYALTPIAQTALIRSLRLMAGVPPMEPIPLDRLLAVTLASNMPLSLLTGALFTMGSALAARSASTGRAVSRVYLLEAIGGFAGGALATALATAGIGPVPVLLAAAGALATGVLAAAVPGRRIVAGIAAALALASCLSLLTPLGGKIEASTIAQRWKATLPGADLVLSFDTPYRNVALARLGAQSILLFDGRVASAFPSVQDPLEDAALAMSESRGARRILVVGLGMTGLLREILEYQVEEVVLLEQDGRMMERIRGFLPEADQEALGDPRVEVIAADPRAWLKETRRVFDLVMIRVPDPETAQMNRLFTVEFFREVKGRLADDGIVTTRVTSAENYMGSEVERYGRSVFATLAAVFPEVVATPGERCVLFASASPGVVTDDAGVLVRRYREMGPLESRFAPEAFHSILEPERVAHVRSIYARPPGPDEPPIANTDARPITYLAQLMVLATTLDSRITAVIDASTSAGAWIGLLPLLVFLLMRTRHLLLFPSPAGPGAYNSAALVAAAGFVAISLDLVMLQAYQNRFGSLFLDVGLMNALFMAGLASGAMAARSILVRDGTRWPLVLCTVAGTAVLAACLPAVLASSPPRPALAALLAGCGLLAGASFPAAGALHPAEVRAPVLASILESADHWGGAVGGLCAGLVLLPLLGVTTTCQLLSAIMVAMLVLLLHQKVSEAVTRPGLLARAVILAREHARRASFPWHGTSALLVGVVSASLALGWIVRARTDRPRVSFNAEEIRAIAGSEDAAEVKSPFRHYVLAPDPGGKGSGILMSSMTVAGDVKGYSGPINLAMLVRGDGTLERVRLLESNETPSYIEGIASWLEASFEGRHIEDDFFLRAGRDDRPDDEHGVDALTGATVTSRAVVEALNRSKNAAAGVLGIQVERAPEPSPWPGLVEPSVIYLLMALVLSVIVYLWGFPGGNPWPRRVFLAANLVLGGFVFNTQLSMEHVTGLMRLELPSISNPEVLVLLCGAIVLAVAFGPLYCGSLCPFGAAQEILSLPGLGVRPSTALERRGRYVRYIVLAALASGWILTGSRSLMSVDPLAHVFSGRITMETAVIVVPVLVLSLFSYRFWCRTLCPVGALLSLLGRIGVLAGLAPAKRYDLCDLGAARDRDSECLHCNRCLTGSTLTRERLAARQVRFPRGVVDRWARLAVAAMVVLLVGTVLIGRPDLPEAGTPATGVPRDVDVEQIRRLLEERKLSGKEALYWRKLGGPASGTGRVPGDEEQAPPSR